MSDERLLEEEEEEDGLTGNDNVGIGKEETNPFKHITLIKPEPKTDDEGCSCVKTETESYYTVLS